jgi:hypothetical protein
MMADRDDGCRNARDPAVGGKRADRTADRLSPFHRPDEPDDSRIELVLVVLGVATAWGLAESLVASVVAARFHPA